MSCLQEINPIEAQWTHLQFRGRHICGHFFRGLHCRILASYRSGVAGPRTISRFLSLPPFPPAQLTEKYFHCSVTGLGQDGLYAARPDYDAVIQAMSGIMDLTGEADGELRKIGAARADILTRNYRVAAIQAALSDRERSRKGQHIDMALFGEPG